MNNKLQVPLNYFVQQLRAVGSRIVYELEPNPEPGLSLLARYILPATLPEAESPSV